MQNGAIFQKSAWKAIFSLSIPSLISIVVMMLYNMADMYFVGWLGDVSQVASVSLAGPVFSVLMAVSTMIGNGGCTKIAQALGKQDMEQVRNCTALCFWASLIFGVVFAAACFLGCNPLLRFLGANEEMWDYTKSYVLILALGAPIILLNHSLGGVLRGEGEVNAGVLGSMISTVTNIVLDPLFIIVFKLGVGGAAAAGKPVMIVTMVQMGICMGIQPLLAYCYGGQEWARLKEIARKVLILTTGLGTALTILIWFCRGPLIGLFIQDAEVAALGAHLVTYMLFLGPFIGIYYFSTNFLQASGNATGASVASALRQGILLIPSLYLMNALLHLEGLALAHLIADGISILITGAMALYYYRKIILHKKQTQTS